MAAVEAPLPHLAPGIHAGPRAPLVCVRRHGDEYAPLRWRAFCDGCGSWRLAPDGSYESWRQLMKDVQFHLLTGWWA